MRGLSRALLVLSLLGACRGADEREGTAPNVPAAADDQYAPSAMIARFRQGVPEHPAQLGGGATTNVDSLLARYVRGVAGADTLALAPLRLTPSEFAWLYYLDAPLAQTPYKLDPEIMWMQMTQQGRRGQTRALARFGGKTLRLTRTSCEAPRVSGALTLLTCTVAFRQAGDSADVSLSLSVVRRDGRYKLTSLATNL